MRSIKASDITSVVKQLFLNANYVIGEDIRKAMQQCCEKEKSDTGKATLRQILESYDIAGNESVAICQDTGMALVFADIGQDVHIEGSFRDAVNQGVREAYTEGYLRASVVRDPLFDRRNTKDNTPAIIHTTLVPGDQLKLTAVAKGFGSENCSGIRMFVPSNTVDDIMDYVVETVVKAGPGSCPPVIVGVGIGGTMETAALLAKRATVQPLGENHPSPDYARLEEAMLEKINAQGIGPGGLGGTTTAIAVNILTHPTHIGALPVAVNLCCHASRHAECTM